MMIPSNLHYVVSLFCFCLIRPNLTTNVTQKGREGSVPQKGAEGIHAEIKSSGIATKREGHTSQDSLSSVDSLNTRLTGDKPWESLAAVGKGSFVVLR